MGSASRTSFEEGAGPAEATGPGENWADAIAAWPPSSKRQKEGPAQGLLLTFRDRALERAYRQFEYERSKKVIVTGLVIGTAILIGFLWLDRLSIPAAHLRLVTSTRLYVLLPGALIGLTGSIYIKKAQYWIPLYSLVIMVGGLWTSMLLLASDGVLFDQSSMGVWNFMIAAFFLCGLPLQRSAPICLVFGTAFLASMVPVHASAKQFAMYASSSLMVFLFGAFAVYRYESATRQQFIAQGMSQILGARELTAEAGRRKWLEVMAAFLRHELNNSMTAISSSVELAERADDRPKLMKFLGRARRSTLFMRRLLAQVADATSVESALVQRPFERLDLSKLVRDRLLDFREDHRAEFTAAIDDSVCVQGNPDTLTQMLDKLLNNAMEHGAPESPIEVALRGDAAVCTLVVADVGDALPEDVEPLFRPFVSRKARRSRAANPGLGLFIARTIAIHHGGTLIAEPLCDGRVGARFVVRLPLSAD